MAGLKQTPSCQASNQATSDYQITIHMCDLFIELGSPSPQPSPSEGRGSNTPLPPLWGKAGMGGKRKSQIKSSGFHLVINFASTLFELLRLLGEGFFHIVRNLH